MHSNTQGKQLWIADETGGYVQVKKAADIRNRPRGRGLPDWWVVEKTPDWRPPRSSFVEEKAPAKRHYPEWVLVDGAPLPEQDGAGGAGPGMKIGAGGKPQGYDSHGRYTGPRGGAASLRHGSVSTFGTDGRLYANDQGDDEEQREDADGPVLTDILLADSGWVATDAGGWDNEARRLEEKQFTPERLVRSAQAEIGSGKWAPTTENGETKNHCNEFVASKLRESGAHVPNVGGYSGAAGEKLSDSLNELTGGRMGGHVPSASDWHRGKVPGFEQVEGTPQPGDVASNGSHVGIVSGKGKTVSASSDTGRVVENNWGFRAQQKPISFWRYMGGPHAK